MARLDVSELLLDPDFIDSVSLIRRNTTVNNFGENVLSDGVTLATVGSVQPAPARELHRVPDALKNSDVRMFFIKAAITVDGSGKYTDVISFAGRRFQIISVFDWLTYGQGWNSGLCVAEVPS